ncbi:RNA pseudouridylate synthase domain-containing protein 1 [Sparganum proliferum]
MANLVGRAFQNRTVKKQYLAIVWGHVKNFAGRPPNYDCRGKYTGFPSLDGKTSVCQCIRDGEYLVDLPIGGCSFVWPDGRKQKICAPAFALGCTRPRSAQTRITVLRHGYLNDLPASYVLLEPLTGRRHQLRIHCAVGLGHPIAGDLIYARLHATDDVYEAANYPLHRMMLHAYRLDLNLLPKRSSFRKNKYTMSEESRPSELRFDLQSSYNLLTDKSTRWTDEKVFEEF